LSTPKDKFRYLTAGEISFCRMIFADAICYSRVKVYNGKWPLLFGMQSSNVVMSLDGNIYYPYDLFREDFSVGDLGEDLKIFIHEMVHVWQYQRGYAVKLNGILSFSKSRYNYDLSKGNGLSDYNMEVQANLIADYFLLIKFGDSGSAKLFDLKYKGKDRDRLLSLYHSVLDDFIKNPHDGSNLPGGRRNSSFRRESHR